MPRPAPSRRLTFALRSTASSEKDNFSVYNMREIANMLTGTT
jgi:hypothetical protein